MAYIKSDTLQHKQGASCEDYIFNLMKKNGMNVYRQKLYKYQSTIPPKVKSYIPNKLKEMFKIYPFDFFLIDNNKLYTFEVKSKIVKFNKDDRKFDISEIQYKTFEYCERNGIKVRILFIWIYKNKYYYQIYDFNKLKIIGKIKLKFKLPNDLEYSPKKVKYKKMI